MRGRAAVLLLLLAVGPLLVLSGVLRPLDLKLLDAQFRLLRTWFTQPAARELVVVGIDDATAHQFPEPISLWHRHLARFLSAMAQAHPAALGIDIVLPDRS